MHVRTSGSMYLIKLLDYAKQNMFPANIISDLEMLEAAQNANVNKKRKMN